MSCDKFGRVFALLWLEQQDEEGSRHHVPCGGDQEFEKKQDDDLRDGAYDLGGTMIRPCKVEHPISQGSADSYSSNCHYSWWRIAGVNRLRFDDDRSYDTTSSHRPYIGGTDEH